MPSTKEKSFGWVGVSDLGGAGGEPFGETPATASSPGQPGSRVVSGWSLEKILSY